MLKCGRCKELKDDELFSSNKSRKNGHSGYCKVCDTAKSLEWRDKHPEKSAEVAAAYRERNRELLADKAREWRQENPEAVLDNKRTYHARHKARLNAARLQRHHANIEQSRVRSRKWARTHPLQCADSRARRRARLRGQAAGKVDYRAIVARDAWACYLCGQSVREGDHHFDHVVPLAKGGAHSTENIRVTHAACNRRKHIHVQPTI